ncbi:MAG TPA: hypothetical protein VLA40_15145 [Rheinheimera sp.]|nr:hypothetical protein [Rheinheimera sp.]
MSVLNKMLRDLEQRQSEPAASAPAIPVSSGRSNTLIAILILCGVLLLLAYFAQSKSRVSESVVLPATSAVDQSAVTAVANEPVTSSPVKFRQPEPDETVAVETTSADAKPVTLDAEITNVAVETVLKAAPDDTAVVMQAEPASAPAVAADVAQEREATSRSSLEVARSQPTTEQQVDALNQQAVAAAQSGQLTQALALWQQVQQLQPGLVTSYLAQARLWLQLGQPVQAERIVRQGLQQGIVSAQLQFLLAQQAASRAEWQQVDTLLPVQFELAQHIEYYGLKATALQQLGRQQAALHWYQQLLQLQPQQARWWLGAALAYDSLQQRENAQLHYRQALQWGETLSSASQQFIQQRLAATE